MSLVNDDVTEKSWAENERHFLLTINQNLGYNLNKQKCCQQLINVTLPSSTQNLVIYQLHLSITTQFYAWMQQKNWQNYNIVPDMIYQISIC